jgi:hypothetical protein
MAQSTDDEKAPDFLEAILRKAAAMEANKRFASAVVAAGEACMRVCTMVHADPGLTLEQRQEKVENFWTALRRDVDPQSVEFGAQVQALYERMRANIITQEEAKRQLDALIEERRVRSKESLDEMHRRLSIAIFTDEDLKDEKEPPPPASSMEH